ncbi:hypothetical protein HFO68_24300 [Rhizobium laguerreae]|uniref:hypothetical protein n=1 Tax=Rhizobium laguerreae TaxID=1076926 RepID=UPI001C92A33B|nr:hypothetical protein [Rhizobium laguerreae]MBY3107655.1 hypothetical protein [Rhizobium laguerreae]
MAGRSSSSLFWFFESFIGTFYRGEANGSTVSRNTNLLLWIKCVMGGMLQGADQPAFIPIPAAVSRTEPACQTGASFLLEFPIGNIVSQHHSVFRQNGSDIVEKHRQFRVAVAKLLLLSF